MCGIFASARKQRVLDMLAQMSYRGPDSSQVVEMGGLCIGFNRLAIVDRAVFEASQPHITRKGNVVAFNGEIYNYMSLWPRAKSEVQLIGEMLDEGLDPRVHFDGDYAILYYNPSTHCLTLYRDRFGVVPLYYSLAEIEVSSERRRLARPQEVPANGKVEIWLGKHPRHTQSFAPLYGMTSESPMLRSIADALEDAVVQRSLHSEVGFSLALSGGLDSSLLAYAMRQRALVPTLSLCAYYSPQSEDLYHARLAADALHFPFFGVQIEHHEAPRIREHLDGRVNTLRWQGALRTWHAAKHAPTTVILCGDGPDELIGGYHSHVTDRPYRSNHRRMTSVRSMQHFNLDRTNKMGMAHSKEYRPPFLASTISNLLLCSEMKPRKAMFRRLLRYYGAPEALIERKYKYSADELAVKL